MKKIIVLYTFVITLVLYSCEKDNSNPGISNDYRLKEVILATTSGVSYESMKLVFTYEGEKLTLEMVYIKYDEDDPWEEYGKTEITYAGENRTETYSEKEDEEWVVYSRGEYSYIDGLKKKEKEYSYDDGQWAITNETSYYYQDTVLTSSIEKDYDDDMELKAEYIYENSELTEIRRYILDENSEWVQTHLETYYHTGDKVTSLVFSERKQADWVNTEKLEFEYTADNNIGEMTSVEWNEYSDSWYSKSKTVEFNYDANGYLIEIIDELFTISYVWGRGTGNIEELWDYDILPYGVSAMSD